MQLNNQEPGKYDDTTIATLPPYLKVKVTEDLDVKKMEEQYLQEIQADKRIEEYFKEYEEWDSKPFIETYAKKKSWFVSESMKYRKYWEVSHHHFYDIAYQYFWAIQQKKLFNLQCQWRAELITLPGIEIAYDFESWSDEIERCPFLELVTEDEVELLNEFFSNGEYHSFKWFSEWQDYTTYKRELEEDAKAIRYPDWYEFYDMRRGTGELLSLPNIRGKKEKIYLDLCHKEEIRLKKEAGTYQEPKPYIPKKRIPYTNQFMIDFIKRFEKIEIQEYMLRHVKSDEEADIDDAYENAVYVLSYAEELVPVEFHENWKIGVIEAAERFETEQMLKGLREVYRDYQFRNVTGIQHPPTHDGTSVCLGISNHYKQNIIKGRILNGEPGDLNF